MSQHSATISWQSKTEDFAYETYTRNHTWSFDNASTVNASATPDYKGDPAKIDPEEAFVASLAACHMLTFLAIACKMKLVVRSYTDSAVGFLEKTDAGKLAITRVELHPVIEFAADAPDQATLDRMHHSAHEHCFIANSVITKVEIL
jgi:organic hydroperoxide reductase OsmC/OhrA